MRSCPSRRHSRCRTMKLRRRGCREKDIRNPRLPDRWLQTVEGLAPRNVVSFQRTQATAVKAALRLARGLRAARRRRGVEAVTHGRNGRIRSKDSFGNETGRKD